MNKTYTLKEYNAKAYSKYVVAINQAVKSQSDFRPILSNYIIDRSSGYVVVIGDDAKYFGSKTKANEYLIQAESEK
jgi:hypothetical protein